ncbi:hypothetical protein GEV33_012689 [Tenebrio molitor]|uniref:Uncharacterized protein n=1 Tax=Tenebrio molitor TaxID=7067 RepID=A0A8J6H932_TENMO|nr:hypothetical protein GEV33_012689 [Tenebrio molitor]
MSFSHTLPKEANFTLPYLHVRGRKPARSRVRGRRGDIWRRGCVDPMINGRFLWTDSRMPKSDRYGDENNLSIGLTKESTRSGGSGPSGVLLPVLHVNDREIGIRGREMGSRDRDIFSRPVSSTRSARFAFVISIRVTRVREGARVVVIKDRRFGCKTSQRSILIIANLTRIRFVHKELFIIRIVSKVISETEQFIKQIDTIVLPRTHPPRRSFAETHFAEHHPKYGLEFIIFVRLRAPALKTYTVLLFFVGPSPETEEIHSATWRKSMRDADAGGAYAGR